MSTTNRLSAADIMTQSVVTAQPNDDVSRIASEMERHKIGSVVIVEKGKVVGILTEREKQEVAGIISSRDLVKVTSEGTSI
jgi:CBS domain-containing protein